MSDTSKILAAFLAGALAGAAVGVLLAPDSGTETRKRIRRKVKRLNSKGKEIIEKIKTRGEQHTDPQI